MATYGTGKIMAIDIEGSPGVADMPEDFTAFCYEKIGTETVEVIRLDYGLDMWVDEGPFGDNPPEVNVVASIISVGLGGPATGLRGVAVLAGHDGEGNTVALTIEQVAITMGVTLEFLEIMDEMAPEDQPEPVS
jgi:hypothetical protein